MLKFNQLMWICSLSLVLNPRVIHSRFIFQLYTQGALVVKTSDLGTENDLKPSMPMCEPNPDPLCPIL